MTDVTLLVALVAGVLSFFSPCVFPLLPGFLAYLAGTDVTTLKQTKGFNKVIFFHTLSYVAGFVIVFATLGFAVSSILKGSGIVFRMWFARAAGALIIVFALQILGLIHIPFLDREHRVAVTGKAGYVTSFLIGMAFAAGWTPCIGAVLGGILTLSFANPASAFGLLFAYSIGLALPFLILGIGYGWLSPYVSKTSRFTRIASSIAGILLLVVGVLLIFDRLSVFGVSTLFANYT